MDAILDEIGWDKEVSDSLTAEEYSELESTVVEYMAEKYWSKRPVWFMIGEQYGEYRIIMFYDNEYNHSDGEDL